MKELVLAAALSAGMAATAPASAAITVLDFTGAACAGSPACTDGDPILSSHGDGVGVDVGYGAYAVPGGALYEPFLRFWRAGYGDLVGVVWGGGDKEGYRSQITLAALPGYEISLRSFDMAAFRGISDASPVRIESLSGTDILVGSILTLHPNHNHLVVDSRYFGDGIVLSWGPDGLNVGLDNIAFDVRLRTAGAAVPQPATWAMMILGFAGVGGRLRQQARRSPAA